MDSALLVAAIAISRLTGKAPRQAQLIFEAMTTPSVSLPGKSMYRGTKTDHRVSVSDARMLLKNYGINTTAVRYPHGDSAEALQLLVDLTEDSTKVVIAVLPDRPVVVVDVDRGRHAVVLDEGPPGDATRHVSPEIPLGEFVIAWETADLEVIIAESADPPTPMPATWSALRPRRESAKGKGASR